MNDMIGALIILAVTVVVGVLLYLWELRWRRRNPAGGEENSDDAGVAVAGADEDSAAGKTQTADSSGGECCGLHLVCEKDSLSPVTDEIVYYDDEELDRFRGRDAESYSPEEEEEFRDVLMTLRPSDVAGWARSITQRRLNLPPDVRDELLMLVNEQRAIQSRSGQ